MPLMDMLVELTECMQRLVAMQDQLLKAVTNVAPPAHCKAEGAHKGEATMERQPSDEVDVGIMRQPFCLVKA